MASLSEPEGYFDSDNFVSNEASYLKVIPALERLGVRGGVYLGVGPDQNYSYIADIRPTLAFLVDIRRQNALQHLYYKALFQLSADRAEYLERLFGRRIRTRSFAYSDAGISELMARVDEADRDPLFGRRKIDEACRTIRAWGIGLDGADINSIRYIAEAFMEAGPDMRFSSYNRPPRLHHPTYRQLLEETDWSGAQRSFLAQEQRFRFIKQMHRENRILPVVGDLGGSSALQRIAAEVRRRGLQVECFYVSNVEFYLFGGERWRRFVENIQALPWAPNGVLIRSYANSWQPHPARIPGYYMTSLLEPARRFLENEATGRDDTYWDLVTRDYVAH